MAQTLNDKSSAVFKGFMVLEREFLCSLDLLTQPRSLIRNMLVAMLARLHPSLLMPGFRSLKHETLRPMLPCCRFTLIGKSAFLGCRIMHHGYLSLWTQRGLVYCSSWADAAQHAST